MTGAETFTFIIFFSMFLGWLGHLLTNHKDRR
jgi:hypothetical protein